MEESITVSESTISEEQETGENTAAQTETEGTEEKSVDETSAAEGNNAENGAGASGENGGETPAEVDKPFLEIKYNHERKGLSREEAASYAQKGMRYESAYKALERNAALEGKNAEDFLKSLEEKRDAAYRQSLAERFGEDEDTINQMMELYELQKQKTLDEAERTAVREREEEEKNLNSRLAEEFLGMKKDFPELTDFSALPASVKQAAAEGMPLAFAYLQYRHNEARRAEAAKQASAEAAKKSAGSIAANDTDGKTDEERRYLNALWGR